MNEKFYPYRGNLTALAGDGKSLAFITVHPEGSATALGRLDGESLELVEEALPCGGRAIVRDEGTVWIAGTDGKIYESSPKGRAPKALKATFDPPAISLALLSKDRLAVLSYATVGIISRAKGEVLQSLELPDVGTTLAADPTGHWLAAGTQKGTVSIFECEEKDEFLLSESAKLHEGAVTALLFEPEELRFLSAGTDNKLLLTHARGKLEPEDRGRGGMHENLVTAILHVPGDRFVTGSRDSTCKSWNRLDRTRPSTLSDGVVSVVGLGLVTIHNRPHLVIAGQDNTLRIFLLDAAGKFGQATHKLSGALDSARHELDQSDPRRREQALRQLAAWNDAESLALLAQRGGGETDVGLRRLAFQLIADSGHPHAAGYLETGLDHADDEVRRTCFDGLVRIHGKHDFRPLDLALKKSHENIAIAAVESLGQFAAKDDRAHSRLVTALEHGKRDVAQAALLALEEVHAKKPEGDLLGLASKKHEGVRRLALIRLLQRKFLDQPRVLSAVRRQLESPSAEVRHAALHVLILSRPTLAAALRERDSDLHRQLFELESFSLEPKEADKKPALPKATKSKAAPTAEDIEPLLQATASRALDTCVAGTRFLALLRDGRALGLLLQLSREEDNAARVTVCRGLADLHDPRAVPRLKSLLFDKANEVRDAAFSALAAIYEDEPLVAADAGLSSGQEDVHRRALELLVRTIRKKPPQKAGDPGWDLLLRALNDAFPGVRSEALKSSLGLAVGGGTGSTLRFVLHSAHADVRREVLTEAIAQARQPWAWELLLELFNDPDATLRAEAFEFALKETKRRDLKPMQAGLQSQFPDVRKLAIEELRKQHSQAAQDLIVTAVNDADLPTRQAALDAIVSAGSRDVIVQALHSQHIDVRLKAAQTLARLGDEATFQPLVDLVNQQRPPKDDPRLPAWRGTVANALDGLSDLGNPAAIPHALPHLDSDFPDVRKQAANALIWSAREEHGDLIATKLRHDDPEVKYAAALGLAIQGRAEARPFVTSAEFRKSQTIGMELIAVTCLGAQGEGDLIRLLDNDDATIRRMALLTLLARELKDNDGTPRRLLACLSSLMPRVRLAAAQAVRLFADPDAFSKFVVEQFNERSDADPWKIPAETVDALCELLVHGQPWIRGRAACVLGVLAPPKQDAFDAWWREIITRFAPEGERLAAAAAKRKKAKGAVEQSELDELAFGTYIGLVREQGGASTKRQQASLGPQVVRVRQTAIARLFEMAMGSEAYRTASVPVLVQALSDPNQDVRTDAFAALEQLKVDPARLAAEAIDTGFDDLGVTGLNLLTRGTSAAESRRVLEDVMLTRTNSLALRAAELLRERSDPIEAATAALDAVNSRLRTLALGWLAAAYEDPKAKSALHGALESRFPEVRRQAAIALASKKDSAAFEALAGMLKEETNDGPQSQLITAIVELGDRRGPAVLLDRLENDPTGTAAVSHLFVATGTFRDPSVAPRILKALDKKEWRGFCTKALVDISGYDQPIEDVDDERVDKSWIAKQHPRHDEILARLMERLVELGESRLTLANLIPSARWSPSHAVEPVLATLAASTDDGVRNMSIAAMGWRLRKRSGPVEPLLKALEHKDPTSRFLAAETLAYGKRPEGISVLLAAIELHDDLDFRRRAVRALGELGDERALDVLLRLAGEDAHALQEVAAEAIGHLGRSDKAEEIFKLLERFSRGDNELARCAICGLRWFNSHDGWKAIREQATNGNGSIQFEVVKALGYNDDPASRDLLLLALAEKEPFDSFDWSYIEEALNSARRLFGADSLEPDYALLRRNYIFESDAVARRSIQRVTEQGEPLRLFELLSECDSDIGDQLHSALLERPELPVDAAARTLESLHARPVTAAAHVLGRAGKASAAVGKAVEAALERWTARLPVVLEERTTNFVAALYKFQALAKAVERLAWTAGRLGVGKRGLIALLELGKQDLEYRPVRRAAVAALGESKLTKEVRDALTPLVSDTDPVLRQQVASILAAEDAKAASGVAGDLVSDRTSFTRLAKTKGVDAKEVVRRSIASVHYQGVVLPFAIAADDEDELAAVAQNRDLPESTRYGAIEGLGCLATKKAEKQLATIGAAKENDEEIRKASWRALRRSKRKREA